MSRKLINTDLTEEALKIANWVLSEPSELRDWGDDQLLMFCSHYDVQEFFDLIEKNTYEFWVDGVTDLSYNGSDYIIDIWYILKHFDIDPKMIIKEIEEADSADNLGMDMDRKEWMKTLNVLEGGKPEEAE